MIKRHFVPHAPSRRHTASLAIMPRKRTAGSMSRDNCPPTASRRARRARRDRPHALQGADAVSNGFAADILVIDERPRLRCLFPRPASVAHRETLPKMRRRLEFVDDGVRIILEGNAAAVLVGAQLVAAKAELAGALGHDEQRRRRQERTFEVVDFAQQVQKLAALARLVCKPPEIAGRRSA